MNKIVPFCPYHFVHTILSNAILSVYHFVHTILSVPFCPLPFCPVTINSRSMQGRQSCGRGWGHAPQILGRNCVGRRGGRGGCRRVVKLLLYLIMYRNCLKMVTFEEK